MASGGLFLFLIIYLAFKGVTSKPVNDISYIEGINFQYENDNWICGDIECPTNTFGCKILIKTSEDRNVLFQTFNCIDEDKNVILGAGDRIELTKIKIIDIEIESYVGAESVYSTGYGLGGHENAKGVISVDGLAHLKETARRNKKTVDDSNA